MKFLNGKEELDLVVKTLMSILPYAQLGQIVKGSNDFVAIITQKDDAPFMVRIQVDFNWINKVLGSYSIEIKSSHDIDKISEEMTAKKVINELLSEIGLN